MFRVSFPSGRLLITSSKLNTHTYTYMKWNEIEWNQTWNKQILFIDWSAHKIKIKKKRRKNYSFLLDDVRKYVYFVFKPRNHLRMKQTNKQQHQLYIAVILHLTIFKCTSIKMHIQKWNVRNGNQQLKKLVLTTLFFSKMDVCICFCVLYLWNLCDMYSLLFFHFRF